MGSLCKHKSIKYKNFQSRLRVISNLPAEKVLHKLLTTRNTFAQKLAEISNAHLVFNSLLGAVAISHLITFTLANARRFYMSRGDLSPFCKTYSSEDCYVSFDWSLIIPQASNFGQWSVPLAQNDATILGHFFGGLPAVELYKGHAVLSTCECPSVFSLFFDKTVTWVYALRTCF